MLGGVPAVQTSPGKGGNANVGRASWKGVDHLSFDEINGRVDMSEFMASGIVVLRYIHDKEPTSKGAIVKGESIPCSSQGLISPDAWL